MSLCINPVCIKPVNPDDQLFCQSCGSELLLDGHYQVIRLMGEGGCGKTYEVQDLNQESKVLKILTRNEPKYVELFQREAQVLAQLNHPGIPHVETNAYFTLQTHGSNAPLHCLVMEKVKGLDLRNYIEKRGKPVEARLVVQWLIQLAHILHAVHTQNFLHRDIKPSNIMLKANGHLALIDFGTARSITNIYEDGVPKPPATRVMSELFTPDEQMKGKPLPQSDFFALGRTAVFLLTAQPLTNFYHPDSDIFSWRSAVPTLPTSFADLLDRMMAPLAAQRPGSAAVLIQELNQIEQSLRGASQVMPPAPVEDVPTQVKHEAGATFESRSVTPAQPVAPSPQSLSSQQPSPSQQQIRPEQVERCQQALAHYIGPIAALICQRTLKEQPAIAESQFIEALSRHVADPDDAKAFRQKLLG